MVNETFNLLNAPEIPTFCRHIGNAAPLSVTRKLMLFKATSHFERFLLVVVIIDNSCGYKIYKMALLASYHPFFSSKRMISIFQLGVLQVDVDDVVS